MNEKIQSLEKRIFDDLYRLNRLFSEIIELRQINGKEEQLINLETDFEYLVNDIFLETVAYLEMLNMPRFLSRFLSKFEQKIKERKIFGENYIEEFGEVIPTIYSELWSFVQPFMPYNKDNDSLIRKNDIKYLYRILKNTDTIIKLQKAQCKNESDIYKIVKPFIEMFFPEAANTNGHVIFNKLKNYKPDILIPDLRSAVEYKLIDENSDIKKTIAEIADDAIGYWKCFL